MSSEFSKSNRQTSYERQNSDIWKPYTVCGYTVTAITKCLFQINALKLLHSYFLLTSTGNSSTKRLHIQGQLRRLVLCRRWSVRGGKRCGRNKKDGRKYFEGLNRNSCTSVVTSTWFSLLSTGFEGKWQACGTTWGRELHVSFKRISRATSQVDTNRWWDKLNSAHFSCKCHNQFAE